MRCIDLVYNKVHIYLIICTIICNLLFCKNLIVCFITLLLRIKSELAQNYMFLLQKNQEYFQQFKKLQNIVNSHDTLRKSTKQFLIIVARLYNCIKLCNLLLERCIYLKTSYNQCMISYLHYLQCIVCS